MGGGWLHLKPGQVTDDTTMSLALGEAILAAGHVDARAAADAFDAWMRAKPVALATFGQPPELVAAACRAQGHVTHHNLLSDAACDTLAAMVHDLLAGQGLDTARRHADALAAAHPLFAWQGKRRDNPSGYVVETLQAVFQALFSTHSFEACLVDVVNRGGDADTTGAIAGMLAGACYGPEAIPTRWRKAVDAQVRETVERQAVALMKRS